MTDSHSSSRERTKELRRNATGPERALWKLLRDRRLKGLKFRRQVPIGPFIVDFICFEKRLIIELDGHSHADRGAYDRDREAYLRTQRFTVLRIDNDDVLAQDIESVEFAVLRAAGIDMQE